MGVLAMRALLFIGSTLDWKLPNRLRQVSLRRVRGFITRGPSGSLGYRATFGRLEFGKQVKGHAASLQQLSVSIASSKHSYSYIQGNFHTCSTCGAALPPSIWGLGITKQSSATLYMGS